jgi:hypothetical protein
VADSKKLIEHFDVDSVKPLIVHETKGGLVIEEWFSSPILPH